MGRLPTAGGKDKPQTLVIKSLTKNDFCGQGLKIAKESAACAKLAKYHLRGFD
jgi:hypothetical protein